MSDPKKKVNLAIYSYNHDAIAVSGHADDQQVLDTVNVPYWTGTGPYPSVTLRMDFRGPDVGDFVYHCHILDHEDNGMMAIIRVLPAEQGGTSTSKEPAAVEPKQRLAEQKK